MRKTAVYLGILVFALLSAEAGLRFIGFGDPPLARLDSDIEYDMVPNRTYWRFGNEIAINRYGMRSDDFDATAIDKSQHIVLLGDSVVYGTHVIDQKQTIAAQLQFLLRNDLHDDKIVVSSIAASSWGPKNILEFYKKKGPFPGAAAFLVLSSHDISDYPSFDPVTVPYRHQATYGALHDFILSALHWALVRIDRGKSAMPYEQRARLTEQALDQLLDILKHDFGTVCLVFHATRREVSSTTSAAEQFYMRKAEAHDVCFLSLRVDYLAASKTGLKIHRDGIHLTGEGAREVARFLSRALARLGRSTQ